MSSMSATRLVFKRLAMASISGSLRVTRRQLHTTKSFRGGGDLIYRRPADPKNVSKPIKYGAEISMAILYWWVFWHIFTEPEHIVGHFTLPISKNWTDEELGIPPDDVDMD